MLGPMPILFAQRAGMLGNPLIEILGPMSIQTRRVLSRLATLANVTDRSHLETGDAGQLNSPT